MTDFDTIRELLAQANMRYGIVVTPDVSTLTVQGKRSRPPMQFSSITFLFTKEGTFTDVHVDGE